MGTSKTIPYISRWTVNQPGAVSFNIWDNQSSPSSPSPSPPWVTTLCPIDSFRQPGETKVLPLDTLRSLLLFKRKNTHDN